MAEDSTSGEQMQADVNFIIKHFQESKRAPNNLKALWIAANQSDVDLTAKTFLGDGSEQHFFAWYAYILLKGDADKSSHFSGKAACSQLVARLTTFSPEYQTQVAAEVAENITADKRMQTVYRTVTQAGTHKRPRTTGADTSNYHEEFDCEQTLDPLLDESIGSESGASLAVIAVIFPADFADSIKRDVNPHDENAFVAAIDMAFPSRQTGFTCQMIIAVADNKIDHLAARLFNVHLETHAGLRYVCLPGGARVLPNPKVILQDCEPEVIPSVLGSETYTGIKANPMFQEERKQGRTKTQCVSMVISHIAVEAALVCVNLGLREGVLFKEKLYP